MSIARLAALIIVSVYTPPANHLDAQVAARGYWQTRYNVSDDRVQITFEDFDYRGRRGGSTSYGIAPSLLQGVSRSQLADGDGAVRFSLVRDAGTFNFEG